MKRIFSAAALVLFLFSLVACSGGMQKNPKRVVEEFVEAMRKKDIDAAAKLCTKESQSTLNMMKMALDMAKQYGQEENANKAFDEWKDKKAEFGEPVISGDMATVAVSVDGRELKKMPLKKEGGKWKIDFTFNALGLGDFNENTGVSQDDINKAKEALKNVNADSLKQALKQAGKALEESAKVLDSLSKQ